MRRDTAEAGAAGAYYSAPVAVDQRSAAGAGGAGDPAEPEPARGRRLALSTAFFSFATGLSRVVGLIREVVSASLFCVSG